MFWAAIGLGVLGYGVYELFFKAPPAPPPLQASTLTTPLGQINVIPGSAPFPSPADSLSVGNLVIATPVGPPFFERLMQITALTLQGDPTVVLAKSVPPSLEFGNASLPILRSQVRQATAEEISRLGGFRGV